MSLLNCHLLLMTYFIVVATRHCTSMITKGETDLQSLRELRELWYVPFLVVGKRERERERGTGPIWRMRGGCTLPPCSRMYRPL